NDPVGISDSSLRYTRAGVPRSSERASIKRVRGRLPSRSRTGCGLLDIAMSRHSTSFQTKVGAASDFARIGRLLSGRIDARRVVPSLPPARYAFTTLDDEAPPTRSGDRPIDRPVRSPVRGLAIAACARAAVHLHRVSRRQLRDRPRHDVRGALTAPRDTAPPAS